MVFAASVSPLASGIPVTCMVAASAVPAGQAGGCGLAPASLSVVCLAAFWGWLGPLGTAAGLGRWS